MGLQQLIPDLSDISFTVHGTTVGLNAFLERKGTRVLLISTAGVRDSYSIARGDRKELYTLKYRKPERLVPRRDVLEVRERLKWDGSVFEPLHEDFWIAPLSAVIASDSDAIQTKRPPQSLSLDCFASLAMTVQTIQFQRLTL